MSALGHFGRWLRERAELVFGLDTRSLALVRIAFGLIVFIDVANRLVDYRFFYTESGALPRVALIEHLLRREHISMFMASGADWWAGVCFAIQLVAAFSFLVGYRTRLANVLLWVMVTGLHSRGGVLLQSGDVVFRLMLFWCVFLPMGDRLSVDSLRRRLVHAPPRHVLGVATVAFQFQLAAVYIWTVLMKTGASWRNGEAVWYALSVDHFAKQPFADFVLSHEPIWRGLTHATFWYEMIGPWLLLVPFFFGPVRTFVVLGFIGMHLGFFAGMELGLFPWICMAGWLMLAPGWLWDRLGWVVPEGRPAARYIGLPWARESTGGWSSGARYALSQSPALFFLWMVFQWNMSTIDGKNWSVPSSVRWIGHTLRLDQKWNMFAPFPLKDDGWYVMPGKLVNGDYVDVWQGGEVAWATDEERATWTKSLESPDEDHDEAYRLSRVKPALVSEMYRNQRWRKYMRNLWQKRYRKLRLYYGKAVCVGWNRNHKGREKLRSFKMVYMKEVTPKPGETTEVVPVQIWTHDCFKSKQDGERVIERERTKMKAQAVRESTGLPRRPVSKELPDEKDDRKVPLEKQVPLPPVALPTPMLNEVPAPSPSSSEPPDPAADEAAQ